MFSLGTLQQGAEVFHPAHDVFGGQTGYQAGTNRYIFKDAFWATINSPDFYDDTSDPYTLEDGGAVAARLTLDYSTGSCRVTHARPLPPEPAQDPCSVAATPHSRSPHCS